LRAASVWREVGVSIPRSQLPKAALTRSGATAEAAATAAAAGVTQQQQQQ
jgi:hypothetical protein